MKLGGNKGDRGIERTGEEGTGYKFNQNTFYTPIKFSIKKACKPSC